MKGRQTRESFLRLLILILTTVDQTMVVLTAHHGSHHHQVSRKIHLPRAMEATKKFLCKDPQSRAYNLRDLVHSMQSSESVSQPVYIVVKKCDSHSGCCVSPDLSCAPVQSSIYHEDMEVEVWSLRTNSTRRAWIRIEQHGKCSCEISSASERHREDTRSPNIQIL
ncbi:platelet-derived growth factor subunit A [Monomorium pharaonis]|uniref:platelet-derived growth factor subunit A n=1 Tax=Monomorium pharaonis TaxID=307658 RepID=UPI00063EEB86|nr:platelet-derived growth factor subunit A [Monomorium pharaonis]